MNKIRSHFLAVAVLIFTAGVINAGPLILCDDAFITPTIDTRIRYEYGSLDTLDVSENGSMRSRIGLITKVNPTEFQRRPGMGDAKNAQKIVTKVALNSIHSPVLRSCNSAFKNQIPIHERISIWLSFECDAPHHNASCSGQ